MDQDRALVRFLWRKPYKPRNGESTVNQQLLDWVNALTNTPANLALLQACAGVVGVTDTGSFGVLRNRVRNRVATYNMTAPAAWTPPGGFPGTPGTPPVITLPGPLALIVGTAFTQNLGVTGGTAPLIWSAVGLPLGLAIDPATGTINGTPTTPGTLTSMVTVRDSATPARTDTQPVAFVVAAAGAPVRVAPLAPIPGFRPRIWTYRRMINRADEPWLDTELMEYGLPVVGTVEQKRYALHQHPLVANRRFLNRVGHDVPAPAPAVPGAPAPTAPRDWATPFLAVTSAAAGIIAILALVWFLAGWAIPWAADHTYGGSDSGDTAVKNGNGGNTSGSGQNGNQTGGNAGIKQLADGQFPWDPPAPASDPNSSQFDKTTIELAQQNHWTHRVFNMRDFHAPDWGGADSWFVSLNIGPNSGGAWTSYGNQGEVIYRAKSTQVAWCIGVLTNSQYKAQFLSNTNDPNQVVGFNVKTAPGTTVAVKTHNGTVKTAPTSDLGDVLVQLPDDGTTTICTAFTSAAPTSESRLHWGPDDRPTEAINRIDAR